MFRIAPQTPIAPKGKRRRARVIPEAPGQRAPRRHDRRHLGFVAQLPCLVSGTPGPSECAHIRFGDAVHGKPATGMQEKPGDMWVVPLCAELHRLNDDAQHNFNERAWWQGHGIDPLTVASELYACSGNLSAMEDVIARHAPLIRAKEDGSC
jgi:hypothetical protein